MQINHAIETLTRQAETSENNAPIWRAEEGNEAQAQLAEQTAKDCREAIQALSHDEGLGIGGGSGDISNGGGSGCVTPN